MAEASKACSIISDRHSRKLTMYQRNGCVCPSSCAVRQLNAASPRICVPSCEAVVNCSVQHQAPLHA